MSHDIEASYAAAEIINSILACPSDCFERLPAPGTVSGYAAREGRHTWPHADGVLELTITGAPRLTTYRIALEFKRRNEGLHGILTAIGQSYAYIKKGYAASVIVVPDQYPGFGHVGPYVSDLLDQTNPASSIGVYTYSEPNLSAVSPFAGKLKLHRALKVDVAPVIPIAELPPRTETQWAHIREGSTEPDAIFKYLQSVKLLGGEGVEQTTPHIPPILVAATARNKPRDHPDKYLASCPNDTLADRAWRHFWFKYVLHPAAIEGWRRSQSGYIINDAPSKLMRIDGGGKKMFFAGRRDSIKSVLVHKLNSNQLTVDAAAEQLVLNYSTRAHSYREDIDSSCEHLGFVDGDGRLTDEGYAFVDACERYGNPNVGIPRALFTKALLGEGALEAFLHYIHRLSDEKFKKDPLAFTKKTNRGIGFESKPYLQWIESEMSGNLRVMRKVSLRGGTTRQPFQAELAILRRLGVVASDFRVGIGLSINWPELQSASAFNTDKY
jgi:hypothetical protein